MAQALDCRGPTPTNFIPLLLPTSNEWHSQRNVHLFENPYNQTIQPCNLVEDCVFIPTFFSLCSFSKYPFLESES
jgi:hypothetical protein